jgi:hypothetical protein
MLNKIKSAAQSTWAGLSPAQQAETIKAVMGGGDSSKEKETTEVAAVSPTGKSGAGAGAGGSKKSIFDLIGDDEKEKAGKDAAKKEEAEGKGLDAYEDSTKQIQDDGKATLFKIIEIRYMKSAYPVFFEKRDE